MSKMLGGACLLTLLTASLLAAPLHADNKPVAFKRTVLAPRYDSNKEVTVQGTVQSVVNKPTPGMMLGGHLIVSTTEGTVDAHVGSFVLSGPHATSFAPGQPVKLVGVMTTINGKSVFLARQIQTGNRTLTVRNQRGFLVVSGRKGNLEHFSLPSGGAR